MSPSLRPVCITSDDIALEPRSAVAINAEKTMSNIRSRIDELKIVQTNLVELCAIQHGIELVREQVKAQPNNADEIAGIRSNLSQLQEGLHQLCSLKEHVGKVCKVQEGLRAVESELQSYANLLRDLCAGEDEEAAVVQKQAVSIIEDVESELGALDAQLSELPVMQSVVDELSAQLDSLSINYGDVAEQEDIKAELDGKDLENFHSNPLSRPYDADVRSEEWTVHVGNDGMIS